MKTLDSSTVGASLSYVRSLGSVCSTTELRPLVEQHIGIRRAQVSWLERLPVTQEVTGSSSIVPAKLKLDI
jgi:hypothetical protein